MDEVAEHPDDWYEGRELKQPRKQEEKPGDRHCSRGFVADESFCKVEFLVRCLLYESQ